MASRSIGHEPPLRRSSPPRALRRPLLVVATAAAASLALLPGAAAFSAASPPSTSHAADDMSPAPRPRYDYPRPLHPGGYSLPPLVEDRLSISTSKGQGDGDGGLLQTDVLLVKPPDVESLWEWLAYTKRNTEGDPSWGRVWPTALSLGRFVLRSLDEGEGAAAGTAATAATGGGGGASLLEGAADALRTASHAVELGCGLGAAGLAYGAAASSDRVGRRRRTVAFLDREPYALHCVMASAAVNGLATAPMEPASNGDGGGEDAPRVTARAALDDWTLPPDDDADGGGAGGPSVKNVCYRDLRLSDLRGHDNERVVLLASDVLYEPSSMPSLAVKLQSLLHPTEGGYALIADPARERTPGCRKAFVTSVEKLGGEVGTFPLPELEGAGTSRGGGAALLEGDVDIDGSLCRSVLIVVRFRGEGGGGPRRLLDRVGA